MEVNQVPPRVEILQNETILISTSILIFESELELFGKEIIEDLTQVNDERNIAVVKHCLRYAG